MLNHFRPDRLSVRQYLIAGVIFLALHFTDTAVSQPFETIWYTHGTGESQLDAFRIHASDISVIAPQAFHATAEGDVVGTVNDSLLAVARAGGVRVMPLILNSGFNQETVHALLNDADARKRCIKQMVEIGRAGEFWGWQFDFENIHISDREALTTFFEEAADALHDAGMILSIAVVPTDGTVGNTTFSRFMRENWRGSFDMQRLADAGDFISLMTYSQHGAAATPGPVGGLPWVEDMLQYALSSGVPLQKISLGIPAYSGYWYAHYDEQRGARVAGREIGYAQVTELLENAGAVLTWMPSQGVHFSYWENSGLFEWLFVEDQRSVGAKLGLFESYPDLRGISVWVLGAEDPMVWDAISKFSSKRSSQ